MQQLEVIAIIAYCTFDGSVHI